jgi:hypothetical protein
MLTEEKRLSRAEVTEGLRCELWVVNHNLWLWVEKQKRKSSSLWTIQLQRSFWEYLTFLRRYCTNNHTPAYSISTSTFGFMKKKFWELLPLTKTVSGKVWMRSKHGYYHYPLMGWGFVLCAWSLPHYSWSILIFGKYQSISYAKLATAFYEKD